MRPGARPPKRFAPSAAAVRRAVTVGSLTFVAASGMAMAQAVPERQALLGTRTPAVKQSRLTSDLFALRQEFVLHVQTNEGGDFQPTTSSLNAAENLVLVDAVATDESAVADLERELTDLGMRDVSSFGLLVSGRFPLSALSATESLDGLAFMRSAESVQRTGSVTSQGDAALYSDMARIDLGLDGTGVKVGTLSDSYDCLQGAAGDVTSGDLPTGVTVLQEGNCTTGTDEGRAMMQIIHDVAPGASQVFQTAAYGTAAFANGILSLEADGADVIVDDVFYLNELFFQDGLVAQAVDAVESLGVSYFSSAGNAARQSYEQDFRPSNSAVLWGVDGDAHDFDPGLGVDLQQAVTIGLGETVRLILQWDTTALSAGPGSPGAATDLDFALLDSAGSVSASSYTANVGGDPVEIISFTNTTQSTSFDLVIERYIPDAPIIAPGFLKYLVIGNMSIDEYFDAPVGSSTIVGHANAAGSFAVGAANYEDTPFFGTTPPVPEAFSSMGGTTMLFAPDGTPINEIRDNPDFMAPDRVDNTFFGVDLEPNGAPNFSGTSAAAPHAAAVAALYHEKVAASGGTFSNSVLEKRLEVTAVDMLAPGEDFDTGFGLIHAQDALADPLVLAPASGVSLGHPTQEFTFNFASLPVNWWYLTAGSTAGGTEYDSSFSTPSTDPNAPVTLGGWPQDSSTVHLTLHYSFDGSATTEVFAFTRQALAASPPPPPVLVAPSGPIGDNRSPTFSWTPEPSATFYRVWISDTTGAVDTTWYTLAEANCDASSCSVTPPIVLAYGTSRWWVRSYNPGGGNGPWSPAKTFNANTATQPAAVPGVVAPIGTGNAPSPAFVWQPTHGATWYQLWVKESPSQGPNALFVKWYRASAGNLPNATGCTSEAGTCSVVTGLTLAPGSYKWWVRPWNGVNGNGPWNPTTTFSVGP